MWLREELLKSIWHAFTALDVDQRGKVSKSQLKVRFGYFPPLLLPVQSLNSAVIFTQQHNR